MLSNQVRSLVFGNLNTHDVRAARCVCKNWSTTKAAWATLILRGELGFRPALNLCEQKQLRELVVDFGCETLTDAFENLRKTSERPQYNVADLSTLQNLHTLCFFSCDIADSALEHLSALKGLRYLVLNRCQDITDACMQHVGKLPELTLLSLKRAKIADFSHLKALPNLVCLNLDECAITDQGFANLCAFDSLAMLFLHWCSNLTDASLAHAARFPHLKHITLTSSFQITDEGVAHLASLCRLETLGLSGCVQLTDAALAHVGQIASLRELDLSECEQLTNRGLAELMPLFNLRALGVRDCSLLTKKGFRTLRVLPNLRSVCVGCKFNQHSFKDYSKCTCNTLETDKCATSGFLVVGIYVLAMVLYSLKNWATTCFRAAAP